ncbi:hypothetical protein ACROYT_G015014 [Oculina patagonica]
MPGLATPYGLNRPLNRTLKDRIPQGEYIDFSALLPDSIHHAKHLDIQFRLVDSSPGPGGSLFYNGLPDAHVAPIHSHTSAAGAVPPAIPSPTAHSSLEAMNEARTSHSERPKK